MRAPFKQEAPPAVVSQFVRSVIADPFALTMFAICAAERHHASDLAVVDFAAANSFQKAV